jgi:putative ABC transport system ATP-binding protein
LVLADEPTANLDSHTGASIVDLMRRLNHADGVAFVLATHDTRLIGQSDKAIYLNDGKIEESK